MDMLHYNLTILELCKLQNQNKSHNLLRTTLLCLWKPLPGNIKTDNISAEMCNNVGIL